LKFSTPKNLKEIGKREPIVIATVKENQEQYTGYKSPKGKGPIQEGKT
jgi:hypothetical protein